ncbi:ABC transporter permease [Agrobacterium sp. ES01]|uniref:ABC transporter permease n=1 Tax=Agrobacterium sp. ES01 TaxID=3420714 RepID=UPI003D0C8C68
MTTINFSRLAKADWFGPLLATLIAIIAIRWYSPNFLSSFNIQTLLLAIAINALIGFSQMIIIAIGQMNLSVGAIGGLSAIAFAGMLQIWGLPVPVAAVLALAIGTLCGIVNGVLINITGISAFVITLATLSIYKGINLGITEAQPFYDIPESVKEFGSALAFGSVPMLALPMVIIAVALWYLLSRLPIGRFILAVGGNEHAASLSGISVRTVVIVAHAISGFIAACAGTLLVARLQIGQPSIGDDWLILSFAAPVIGGAVLSGGHVSVVATFLGVVIVALITQALVLFSIDPFLVQVVLGTLILAAVGINRLRGTRRAVRRA